MIWLAGGRPFSTSNDGKNVTIRLTEDKGTREFTEFWQKMIDEMLMHAMGPNVAGVIGTAVAAGTMLAMLANH